MRSGAFHVWKYCAFNDAMGIIPHFGAYIFL